MVIKEADPAKGSRLSLSLTPKGEVVSTAHEAYHQQCDDLINGLLEPWLPEERVLILKFLKALNDHMEREELRDAIQNGNH